MSTETVHVDPDLVAAVRQLFSDKSTPEVVAEAEQKGLPAQLWKQAEALGLPLVGISEEFGGSGGTLVDLLAILSAAGEFAVPLPLAQTHLAAWLMAGAGLPVPAGPLTVAPGTAADVLSVAAGKASGTLHDVPWARGAEAIVMLAGSDVVVVKPTDCTITPGTDLAGMPRDIVTFTDAAVTVGPSVAGADELFLRGALVTAAQLAGAIEAASSITQQYVAERVQFGKPVGQFQAVQQHVVTLAQMAAMTSLNVVRAGLAAMAGSAAFEICCLKQVADKNATLAYRAAHQAHGAIGMTQEYRLQLVTRRLLSWRAQFGDEQQLALRIGQAVGGSGRLAAIITGGSAEVEV